MREWQRALREVFKWDNAQRKLWLPFLLTAVLECLFLLALWLAPHPSFRSILAPPVHFFYSERVLHYPWHLWLIFHGVKHTHALATLLAGAFLSGIASLMVEQVHQNQRLSFRAAFVSRRARYGRLVILWLTAWALATGIIEGLSRSLPKTAWAVWLIVVVVIVVQALVVFLIPAAVFEGLGWWKAFLRGMEESLKHPVSTLAIVGVPSLLLIGFSFFINDAQVTRWIMRFAPEVAVVCAVARLAVVTLADGLLTLGAAHVWCLRRSS